MIQKEKKISDPLSSRCCFFFLLDNALGLGLDCRAPHSRLAPQAIEHGYLGRDLSRHFHTRGHEAVSPRSDHVSDEPERLGEIRGQNRQRTYVTINLGGRTRRTLCGQCGFIERFWKAAENMNTLEQ